MMILHQLLVLLITTTIQSSLTYADKSPNIQPQAWLIRKPQSSSSTTTTCGDSLSPTYTSSLLLSHQYQILHTQPTAQQQQQQLIATAALVTPRIGNWDQIVIIAKNGNSELENNFAVGALHGYLLANRIQELINNNKQLRVQNLLQQTTDYVNSWFENVVHKATITTNSAFWSKIQLMIARMDGLISTAIKCTNSQSPQITIQDLILLQFDGDVGDIEQMVLLQQQSNNGGGQQLLSTKITSKLVSQGSSTAHRVSQHLHNGRNKAQRNDHSMWHDVQSTAKCSALIRILPTTGDVVFGHTTWAPYVEMIRVMTFLDMGSYQVQYSGYAGMLASTDDWYQTSRGMAILETSLNIIDKESYNRIQQQILQPTVPGWLRTSIAAEWAVNANDFITWINNENSFTYNSQFLILDRKQFGLPTGMFTMFESLPNVFGQVDLTQELIETGYFSGQNTPYLSQVRDAGFYPDISQQIASGICQECNCLYSYNNNPRGCIFKRDAPNTQTIEDVQELMWSNHYLTDPLSFGLPQNAIAGRYDLLPEGDVLRKPIGAIDSKISSFTMFGKTLLKVNGPIVNSECPIFNWFNHPDLHPEISLEEVDGDGWVEVGWVFGYRK
jgi:hypothetical protein